MHAYHAVCHEKNPKNLKNDLQLWTNQNIRSILRLHAAETANNFPYPKVACYSGLKQWPTTKSFTRRSSGMYDK